MPARKRTAEARRRARRAVAARAWEIRLDRREAQEESAWSEHEYYTRPDPTVWPEPEWVPPWEAVVERAREVLGPPGRSPRVWVHLLEVDRTN